MMNSTSAIMRRVQFSVATNQAITGMAAMRPMVIRFGILVICEVWAMGGDDKIGGRGSSQSWVIAGTAALPPPSLPLGGGETRCVLDGVMPLACSSPRGGR